MPPPPQSLLHHPSPVANDGLCGCVDHGGVVYWWKVAVQKVEFVLPQEDGPDGLDLNIGKALPNTSMAAWGREHNSEDNHAYKTY